MPMLALIADYQTKNCFVILSAAKDLLFILTTIDVYTFRIYTEAEIDRIPILGHATPLDSVSDFPRMFHVEHWPLQRRGYFRLRWDSCARKQVLRCAQDDKEFL
jgi:hypothetical protein